MRVVRTVVLALSTVLAVPLSAGAQPKPSAQHSNQADARQLPACPMPSRVIAIVSTRGKDSLAVLSAPGADEGGWQQLVRVGDRFGGARVGHIGIERVWLHLPSGWCHLGRSLPVPPVTPSTMPPVNSRAQASSRRMPEEIASSIRRVGEGEFQVDRSVVDTIIEQHQSLLRGVQVVPKTEKGKAVAVGLRGVADGSMLHALGLRSGDELLSINGFNIAEPQSALQAYAKLRTAPHITLSVMRGGKPMSIDIGVK